MSVGTAGDKARQYKDALLTAAQTSTTPLIDTAHDLLVRYGAPSRSQMKSYDDIIAVTGMRVTQTVGPMSQRRPRDLEMAATVMVSVFRAGGDDLDDDDTLEQTCGDRAYSLLDALEEYVRVTDTTLGGLVWDCFCTDHESAGVTDPAVLARGRCIEIEATFTAHARITN